MTETWPETGPDAAFQARLADGHLWIQRCDDCGGAVFHPRLLCNHCGSPKLTWERASGRGTIYARTALISRPKEGETEPRKHCLVLVDLDEGPRMMSRLPDVASDEITIGMKVTARITGDEGARVVVFDKAEGAA